MLLQRDWEGDAEILKVGVVLIGLAVDEGEE